MGLFGRIWRVIRANINSLIGRAEDPEKILEQTVMDMQDDLVQLRQAVAGAIATQKRTERDCSQAKTTAEEWYRRAQLALQKGEEGLAREALSRRKSYLETEAAMSSQLQQQEQIVEQLRQNMRKLETKISEVKAKKDLFVARARSAKASEKLNEILGNTTAGGALNAFEQMEDKVMELEARSQAIAELSGDDLEQQFHALESGEDDIDAELAAMKAKMLPGNPEP